jgi:hypothetical protein
MRRRHVPARLLLPLACALALLVASGAGAAQAPGRTIVRSGPVGIVALNHASFAFAVGRSARDCDHVELWNVDTRGVWRFGRPGPCTDLGSTGTGIGALGVSGNRALWVRYTGGNERDWQLLTATTTQRLPRRLRLVEQDVDLPSPFAIGDSTAGLGIPYAAGREVVLLGTNGAAVFKHLDASRIVAVTAGNGPSGAVVAALRETGAVVLLRRDGSAAWTASYPERAVKAIALAPAGLVVQLDGSVEIRRASGTSVGAPLPTGAVMRDYAEGRVLYTLKNDVRSLQISSGKDVLLLRGVTGKPPLVATQDTHGLGWAKGASVRFACGGCVRYTP